jgi:agmatine deiminase
VLAHRYADAVVEAPLVLEGGSIVIDGEGRIVTTEQCLLNPNRNPDLDRHGIEEALAAHLGASGVVWLGDGLVGDRDTDGHLDMLATFTDGGALLLMTRPPGDPDHASLAENRARAEAAGLEVLEFPLVGAGTVAGQRITLSYLNLTLCNGGVIVPLAGEAGEGPDDEAMALVAEAFPEREVVGVPALTIAFGGGGPHCITQQVPAI